MEVGLDQWVPLVPRGLQDQLDHQAHLDLQTDLRALRGLRVHLAARAPRDLLDLEVCRVQLDRRGQRVLRVNLGQQGLKALKVPLDPWGLLDHQDQQVSLLYHRLQLSRIFRDSHGFSS